MGISQSIVLNTKETCLLMDIYLKEKDKKIF